MPGLFSLAGPCAWVGTHALRPLKWVEGVPHGCQRPSGPFEPEICGETKKEAPPDGGTRRGFLGSIGGNLSDGGEPSRPRHSSAMFRNDPQSHSQFETSCMIRP